MIHFHNSSVIASAEYQAETQQLLIVFRSGDPRVYTGVPFEVYDKFMTAESPGKYYHANIKGKYQSQVQT